MLLFPLLFWRSSDDNIDPLGAAVLPQDAALLLHTGTWTLSGAVNPFPREKMYFYNAEGEVLTSTLDMEEFLGKQVFLETYVKTLKNWRDQEKYLLELGLKEDDE